jgi:hypothetical protein
MKKGVVFMHEQHDFTATIINPDRKTDWLTALQTDTLPIKSPVSHLADLAGIARPVPVYDVDLAAFTPDQRQSLVAHIAERFDLDLADVEAKLDKHGLPILANDVTVTVHRPELFL